MFSGCYEAGKFNSASGATNCLSCFDGEYSTTDQADTDGFGVASGATRCATCPAGKYQDSLNSTYYFSSCEVGKTSVERSTIFTPCVSGRYTDSMGSGKCIQCEARKYQPDNGSVACETCESPKTSMLGEANCSHCEVDHYRKDDKCMSCSEGARCSSFTTTIEMVIKEGFYRFTPYSSKVYPCRYSSACTSTSKKTGDDICDPNGKGPLCAYCSDEFYMYASTGTCLKCPRQDWTGYNTHLMPVGMIIVLICIAMVCFKCNVCIAIAGLTGAIRWQCVEKLEGLWRKLVAILTSADKSPFTILWFFFQTSTQFVNKYDEVKYPSSFKELISILKYLTIDFTAFPTTCMDVDFYAVLLFTVCWWPMVAGLTFLLFLTVRNFSKDPNRTMRVMYARVVVILAMFHSSIVTVIFKTFDCTDGYHTKGSEYDDGGGTTRVPMADMTLPCNGSAHKNYELLAYLGR